MSMRRNNRRNNAKKERIVMFASSAFVLAALTMTGIYMQSRNVESQDNGYTIDFTALEESVDNKYHEIAQDTQTNVEEVPNIMEDDLDYTPMEVGSGQIEIPGLTDSAAEDMTKEQVEEDEIPKAEDSSNGADNSEAETNKTRMNEARAGEAEQVQTEEASSQDVVAIRTLHFSEANGLIKPVTGETIIPYSMGGTTYFATLDQYKYNPAVIIGTEENSAVSACAEGRVISIFENEEIGHAVKMELGDGYVITYGQLKNINVSLNSYVNAGDVVGSVAAPTKYYSVEGSNLYLQLTKDGVPVNPERLF